MSDIGDTVITSTGPDLNADATFIDNSGSLQHDSSISGNSSIDGNSLVAALAGAGTKIGTALFAEQAAKATVKANPNSATTLILVVGGVAALFVILLVLKK